MTVDLFAEVQERVPGVGACLRSSVAAEEVHQTVAELVHTVTERHGRRGLGGRLWSLAELGIDSEDHAFLCRALTGLQGTVLQDSLTKSAFSQNDIGIRFDNKVVTARGALGLLILLACAESARRWATEGEIWAAAARSLTNAPLLHKALFSPQGQPTEDCKQALRDAVTAFGLRHVLPPQTTDTADEVPGHPVVSDAERRKWWFHTIKLQYGVSAPVATGGGLTDFLVSGGGPDAVRWLLYGLPGEVPRSESFRRFFADLQQFRKGAIDPTELRSRLGRSPWLPPVSFTDLEKAVRRRRQKINGVEIEPETIRLVADLRLLWNGSAVHAPVLQFRLEPEVLNSVLEVAVQITANGVVIGEAFRQEDGQMFPVAHGAFGVTGDPLAFHLPFVGNPELTVSLTMTESRAVSEGAETLHADTVFLYKTGDEVSAFSLEGHGVGAGIDLSLVRGRGYLLLLGDGLELASTAAVASDTYSRWPFNGQGTLYAVAPGWRGPLQAFFPEMPDEPLWVSDKAGGVTTLPPPAQEPNWVDSCTYRMKPLLGDDPRIGLRVTTPEGVEVVRTRYNGQSTLAADTNGLWGTISAASAPPHLSIVLWLSCGNEKPVRVHRMVATPQAGRAFYRRADMPGGWAVCPATKTLPVKSLASGVALRVFAPDNWRCDGDENNPKGSLFEGACLLGQIPLGLSRLQGAKFASPSGWGGRLVVRCRRFNDPDTPVVIAKAVADFGVLSPVKPEDRGENTLLLRFTQSLTLTEETRVHLWDDTGRMTTRDAQEIEVRTSREWRVPLWEEDGRRACIVAVSFRGVRVGARLLPGLIKALPTFGTDDGSTTAIMKIAAWLRWLRLPLLRED